MSSTTLLDTSSAQVTATTTATNTGDEAAIVDLTLSAQPGSGRLAELSIVVTPSGGTPVPVTVQFLMVDAAFEETDAYGAPRGSGSSSSLPTTSV